MTTKPIHIRSAGPADISLLSDLIRRSFLDVAQRFVLTVENCPKHPSNCTDAWIESDFKRGVGYFILEDQGRAVGCVGMEKDSPDMCYLERLAVLPDKRRGGFGKALVNHVLARAKEAGVKQVGIGIIARQGELRTWYGKIGFSDGETRVFEHLPFSVLFMTYEFSNRIQAG